MLRLRSSRPTSPPTACGRSRLPLPAASILLALIALLPWPVAAQATPLPPCAAPEYRAFDFWVGSWEVYQPDGTRAGRNDIRSVMGGCVLHESYDGQGGFHGESFNTWDPARGVWHQSWVDNRGTLLVLEGGMEGGAMVLEGQTMRPDGTEILNRITWTVLDEGGDRVRQHWIATTDGGESWTTVFDGEYRRRVPSAG